MASTAAPRPGPLQPSVAAKRVLVSVLRVRDLNLRFLPTGLNGCNRSGSRISEKHAFLSISATDRFDGFSHLPHVHILGDMDQDHDLGRIEGGHASCGLLFSAGAQPSRSERYPQWL
jgi:hypothetical protein